MIVFGMTVLILAMLTLCGVSWVGGASWARKHTPTPQLAPVIVTTAPQLLAELRVAHDHMALMVEGQRIVEAVEVAPTSPYTALPWQQVPSPARTFWAQGLVEEIQDLRADVAQLEGDVYYFADLAAKRWKWLKTAREKVRQLTPVVAELPLMYADFERECSLKDAYHEKARSFAERITTAREAIASEAMRDEIDSILGGNVLPFPARERQAA